MSEPIEYDETAIYNQKVTKAQINADLNGAWKWPNCRFYWKLAFPPPYTQAALNNFTVAGLRTICKAWGLSETGSKSNLIERVNKANQNRNMAYLYTLHQQKQKQRQRKRDSDGSDSSDSQEDSESDKDNDNNNNRENQNDRNKNRNNKRERNRDRSSDRETGNDRNNPNRNRDRDRERSNDRERSSDRDKELHRDLFRPGDDDNNHNRNNNNMTNNTILSALRGFNVFNEMEKIDVKITGEQGEDILRKLADINYYKETSEKTEHNIWRWITNCVLEGQAKILYMTAWTEEKYIVNNYGKLLLWLYKTLRGRLVVDARKQAWKQIKQDYTEPPKDYFTRYDTAVKQYAFAIKTAMIYEAHIREDQQRVFREPSKEKLYNQFINKTNEATQAHIRLYFNLNNITETYDEINITAAVDYADKTLNPSVDIILHGKQEHLLRKRKLNDIYVTNYQQHIYEQAPSHKRQRDAQYQQRERDRYNNYGYRQRGRGRGAYQYSTRGTRGRGRGYRGRGRTISTSI